MSIEREAQGVMRDRERASDYNAVTRDGFLGEVIPALNPQEEVRDGQVNGKKVRLGFNGKGCLYRFLRHQVSMACSKNITFKEVRE